MNSLNRKFLDADAQSTYTAAAVILVGVNTVIRWAVITR